MANLSIRFGDNGTFPPEFVGTPNDLRLAIADSLTATIDSTSLLVGKVGGTIPATSIGPWLNGRTWYVWNGTTYGPATIKVGNANNQVTLTANPNATRVATFQDKDGIVALKSDIYTPRPTEVLSGTAPVVDWSLSNSFYQQISAHTTFSQKGSYPGQEIWIVVKATGAFNAIFGASIFWIGPNPAQTSSGTDLYILKNVGGTIYGKQYPDYA